jgi:hypothetical protein
VPTLLDPKGQPVDIDDPEEAAHAFLNAKFQLPHADAIVPMADPDGKIGGVKASDAYQMLKAGGRFVTADEHKTAYLDEKYGGVGGTLKAGAAGFARGATLDLSDLVAGAVSPSAARSLRELKEAHPIVSAGTQIAGGLAPIILSGGAAAPEEGALLAGEGLEAAAGAARGTEALGEAGAAGAEAAAPALETAGQAAPTAADAAAGRGMEVTDMHGNVHALDARGWPSGTASWAEPMATEAAPTAADAQAFEAAKATVDSPVARQVATDAAAAKNPAAAAYQTMAQYSPPNLVAKAGEWAGETADSLLGKIVGPPTTNFGRVASRVVKTVATGALEGGIYNAADQLDEQALGDPELNAEKVIAAFGHGALFGGLIGGGLAGTGEVGRSLLARTSPKLQGLTDELALRSLEVGGGRRASLIEKAEQKFEGGAKAAARFVNDEGLIVPTDNIAQRAKRIDAAARMHADTLDGLVQGAQDSGAEGVTVSKIENELRESRVVKDMALTADLNTSLLGVHPEEQGLSSSQAAFLHAITRTGRHVPEIAAEEAADLASRGLVAESLMPTRRARIALTADVNDAEHGLLTQISRDGYGKTLKKFPDTEPLLAQLKDRRLITTQGRLTTAGEFAIGPQGRLAAREREILAHLGEGRVAGTEEEMAALRKAGFVKTGYKITESGRVVSGLTKRGLIDNIVDTMVRSAGPDGNIPLAQARKLRVRYGFLSNYDRASPRTGDELKLYRTVERLIEDHIEGSLKGLNKDIPGVFKKYKDAKEAYSKLSWAARLATKSAAAKLSNQRMGLVAKLAAVTSIAGGHPVSAAGIVAGKFASEYAPGAAAAMLQKLTRFSTIERAARKVDEDINASSRGWFDRMTGGSKKRTVGKTVTRGVTRSLRDEKVEGRTEPAERAHTTIERLHALSAAGPIDEAKTSAALGGIGEHAPQTNGHIASKLNASVQYLASIVPQEHADYSDITKPRRGRLPSIDYQQFASQAKAVEEPLQVFRDFAAGRASRTALQTVKKNSPKIFDQFVSGVLRDMSRDPERTTRMPYQAQMQLGYLLDVPTHWSMQPAGMRFLQADQSTVAKSPNSAPGGNKMGPRVKFAHDLGAQTETSVEKITLQSGPGKKGR